MKRISILASCAWAVLLAGCGGPSNSDVEKELGDTLVKGGAKVHSVKNLGCVAAQGANGYLCDVQTDVTVKMPFVGPMRKASTGKVRLVNVDGKWTIVDAG